MRGRHRIEPTLGTTSPRRVIERLTRTDHMSLLYRFTVDDSSVFARPFSGELIMRRTDARVFEYACHEGNYGIAGVLRGARAAEKER